MGHVIRLKRNQLVGGVDSEPVYPITATNAVYRGAKDLETILSELGADANKKVVRDVTYDDETSIITVAYTDDTTKTIEIQTGSGSDGYPNVTVSNGSIVNISSSFSNTPSSVTITPKNIDSLGISLFVVTIKLTDSNYDWCSGNFILSMPYDYAESSTQNFYPDNSYLIISNESPNFLPTTESWKDESTHSEDYQNFLKRTSLTQEILTENNTGVGSGCMGFKKLKFITTHSRRSGWITNTNLESFINIYVGVAKSATVSSSLSGGVNTTYSKPTATLEPALVSNNDNSGGSSIYPILTATWDSTLKANIVTFTNNTSSLISSIDLRTVVSSGNVYIPCILRIGSDVPYETINSKKVYNPAWHYGIARINIKDIYRTSNNTPTDINDCSLLYRTGSIDSPKGVYLCVKEENILGVSETIQNKQSCTFPYKVYNKDANSYMDYQQKSMSFNYQKVSPNTISGTGYERIVSFIQCCIGVYENPTTGECEPTGILDISPLCTAIPNTEIISVNTVEVP